MPQVIYQISGMNVSNDSAAKMLTQYLLSDRADDAFAMFRANPAWRVVCFCIMLAVIVLGFIGNSLILYIIKVSPQFHTVPYVLMANLAVADQLILSFIMPGISAAVYVGQAVITGTACTICGFLNDTIISAEMATLIVVALNRYLKIVHNLHYYKIFRKTNTTLIIIIIWASSFLFMLPTQIGWGATGYDHFYHACKYLAEASASYNVFFNLRQMVTIAFMIYCYVAILLRVRKSRGIVSQHNQQPQNIFPEMQQNNGRSADSSNKEDVFIVESHNAGEMVRKNEAQHQAAYTLQGGAKKLSDREGDNIRQTSVELPTSTGYIMVNRSRVGGARMRMRGRSTPRRADIALSLQFFLIFLIFMLAWGTHSVLVILVEALDLGSTLNDMFLFSLCFIAANSAVNPLIFYYFNREMKAEIKKFTGAVHCKLTGDRDGVNTERFAVASTVKETVGRAHSAAVIAE